MRWRYLIFHSLLSLSQGTMKLCDSSFSFGFLFKSTLCKLLLISIMFIFWILFLQNFLAFLSPLSPWLYFTFTIMVPFVVFALGTFFFRFLLSLWPFRLSPFLLMEKWQHNMDKLFSYGLEFEHVDAWGRNLVIVFLWGLSAKFGIRTSSCFKTRDQRQST